MNFLSWFSFLVLSRTVRLTVWPPLSLPLHQQNEIQYSPPTGNSTQSVFAEKSQKSTTSSKLENPLFPWSTKKSLDKELKPSSVKARGIAWGQKVKGTEKETLSAISHLPGEEGRFVLLLFSLFSFIQILSYHLEENQGLCLKYKSLYFVLHLPTRRRTSPFCELSGWQWPIIREKTPPFSGGGTWAEAGAWGGMCRKDTFLIIKDNSKGKQWPHRRGSQQKPNPQPGAADGDAGCREARADAREGASLKPSRSPVQSLASGPFRCQPCLASGLSAWLPRRKRQRTGLQRSRLRPASNRTRRCQDGAAVPSGCQCALEHSFYVFWGDDRIPAKRTGQIQHAEPVLPFSFYKEKKKKYIYIYRYICSLYPQSISFFTRLMWPAPLLLCS